MSKLPPGIPDVSTWGRTVIGFRMYEKDDLSYEELAVSQEERKKSYVKWVLTRHASAKGQLKDLCEYLKFFESMNEPCDGPMIPGTSQRRRLKQ